MSMLISTMIIHAQYVPNMSLPTNCVRSWRSLIRKTSTDVRPYTAKYSVWMISNKLRTCTHTFRMAVTKIYFGVGMGWRSFLPSLPSLSLLSFALLSFSPFHASKWLQIQVRDLGSAVSSPNWINDICGHQTRSLGSKICQKCVCLRSSSGRLSTTAIWPVANYTQWTIKNVTLYFWL